MRPPTAALALFSLLLVIPASVARPVETAAAAAPGVPVLLEGVVHWSDPSTSCDTLTTLVIEPTGGDTVRVVEEMTWENPCAFATPFGPLPVSNPFTGDLFEGTGNAAVGWTVTNTPYWISYFPYQLALTPDGAGSYHLHAESTFAQDGEVARVA